MRSSRTEIHSANLEITPKQLRRFIKTLPAHQTFTVGFNAALGFESPGPTSWYKNQKEHWLGWLDEIEGPGAFGRQKGHVLAKRVYNSIQNPSMLIWLGEASGVPRSRLNQAKRAAVASRRSSSAWCGAVRKSIPWELIELIIRTKIRRRLR